MKSGASFTFRTLMVTIVVSDFAERVLSLDFDLVARLRALGVQLRPCLDLDLAGAEIYAERASMSAPPVMV